MKTMTCKQMGGACDLAFHANTFGEMIRQSQQHGMEMAKVQEAAHLEAMSKMKELMQTPEAMEAWQDTLRQEFDRL